eukprot:CAMPEP_0201219222 /NCGR_PEP_ID=MMETSP0851-20130426/190970_1 /ASSEMBLY_ACC=CAM_ASM_000631 /TAXON_ID=183588 /ORGANISM="Pseudo-nitzschia fraudulenta, Strain WWA7" /LENGTH=928 /DNA_ID=CAMNT_0047508911 /DNA_START=146 /DNA_END=2932 /DNA_ORIENTATION=+
MAPGSRSSELSDIIPKLSDILEGRQGSSGSNEVGESKTKQRIQVTNLNSRQKRDPIVGTARKTEVPNTNTNNGQKANFATEKRQRRPRASKQSNSSTQGFVPQGLVPWRANYRSSKRTQGKLQKAFNEWTGGSRHSHSRAQRVLDTLLETPPEFCNAVNLVCAMTYSAKAMGHRRMDHLDNNLDFRKSLQKTLDILHDLLVVHREDGLFTPRQLSNIVWAIAKHVDRDPDLLLSQGDNSDSPESRLEESIDEIARQLTTILFEDDENGDDVDSDSSIDSKPIKSSFQKPKIKLGEICMACLAFGKLSDSKPIKSSFQKPKIKLGEICMACWAFGKLRHREIPPGWPAPPQMGEVKRQGGILADWKTEQLGTRRIFGSMIDDEDDDSNNEGREISETNRLFDAIGYALCRSSNGKNQQDTLDENHFEAALLKDCTWSELANVGWAFAAHGRCRSAESEMLLKNVAFEASKRLAEDGTIANNSNYQQFLVRDITQLLWSLGTLQADNFRLADDLVLLVESLTSNLRLGTKTRSSFAQGRPLRRWSCADLVQTAVALAHARIDENLLLRAIYEEGNYRLMEGASSSRKLSSMTNTLPSRNDSLPFGEDRRTFHPWEASILLWSQARLFLTEQEGIEFDEFAQDAPLFFLKALRESRGSFAKSRIGSQEQANIVWSLVILEKYDSPEAIILIDLIFAEAARSCKEKKSMQLEHAHQLWQAYFILEEDCPEAVKRIPDWFVSYLKDKWNLEKSRLKKSSARHQSLSSTLQLMGVDHINEHDEDIDVAIILQPNAVWVHETDMDEFEVSEAGLDGEDHVSVAVEFDGPNHFTRVRAESEKIAGAPKTFAGPPKTKPEPPRALGHTVLKYRLLKKQGWTVVRVPYYEFDRIPFWASMERQRYLQRKLKTHANIQFSEVDVSEYKALTPNRESRFD